MKNILLGLIFVSAAAAMETNFSIDPRGIVPEAKCCLICQNNAPRVGTIDKPISIMLSDGQCFAYTAHDACYKQIVTPLLATIEKDYPVGKVKPAVVQEFLWGLYITAYRACSSMRSTYTDKKVLADIFKAYLADVLS